METLSIIIGLFILLGVFGSVGYVFVREVGTDQARSWLRSPASVRRAMTSVTTRPSADEPTDAATDSTPRQLSATSTSAGQETTGYSLAVEDMLRDMREELQNDLRAAAGLTREFDARLTRIEARSDEQKHIPEELRQEIQQQSQRHDEHVVRVRDDLVRVHKGMTRLRQTSGDRGERHSKAIADLYQSLAQFESALSAVVNPKLLPGEPLQLPDDFYPDTLDWENWNDVGERAFAFGSAFNGSRYVLEADVSREIEGFIVTLRQALTGAIYPNVRDGSPSAAQKKQVWGGLEEIVRAVPTVRQRLEHAYRQDDDPEGTGESDDRPNA